MKLLTSTIAGLEDISITEIKEITGSLATVEHKGMVRFEGKEEDIFKLNYLSKSLHRVLILLIEGTFSHLGDIYEKTKEINYADLIHPRQKFAVRANRYGEHSFTSMDVERVVGQAVIDSFEKQKNLRLGVDLENPDIIFRVYVKENKFWMALDTTGVNSLHKRGYRVYQHPASLKPSISHCLVRLSCWQDDESLIDPMCGSGTICIEASLFANKIPNWFRQDFSFWNFHFLDKKAFLYLKKEFDEKVKRKNLNIQGCDLFEKHIQGAKKNAKKAGVEIKFFKGDAREIPLNYDRIITNPPYGIRIGSIRKIKKLYENFLSNLYKWNWKKAVILTAHPHFIPGEKVEKKIDIAYGKLPASILIMRR